MPKLPDAFNSKKKEQFSSRLFLTTVCIGLWDVKFKLEASFWFLICKANQIISISLKSVTPISITKVPSQFYKFSNG